jgi:predicted nuclease with TOPRIM domain
MDLAAVRTNLLSTSQNYTAISEKNSQFNLKLEQVKSNLKVLEKEKSNLAKV